MLRKSLYLRINSNPLPNATDAASDSEVMYDYKDDPDRNFGFVSGAAEFLKGLDLSIVWREFVPDSGPTTDFEQSGAHSMRFGDGQLRFKHRFNFGG